MSNPELLDKFRDHLIKYYDEEVSLIYGGPQAFCNALSQVCAEVLRQDAPPEILAQAVSSQSLIMIGACYGQSRAKAIEVLLYSMLHLIILIKGECTKSEFLNQMADAWDDNCTRPL